MNKFRYLEELSSRISYYLPEEEYRNVMQYYTEYFADAGEENEATVMEELGTPEVLAKKIIADYKGKQPEELHDKAPDKKRLSVGWVIFIAIIGAPLWIALFGIAIGIIATAFALVVSVGAVAIGGIFGGIGMIFGGIILLFTSPGAGLLTMGGGFVLGAVGIGFLMLSILIVQLVVKMCRAIFSGRKNRRAAL